MKCKRNVNYLCNENYYRCIVNCMLIPVESWIETGGQALIILSTWMYTEWAVTSRDKDLLLEMRVALSNTFSTNTITMGQTAALGVVNVTSFSDCNQKEQFECTWTFTQSLWQAEMVNKESQTRCHVLLLWGSFRRKLKNPSEITPMRFY